MSELRNNFDGISMAKINEFMDANIGVKDSKSNKAVAKLSTGFMCSACDENNEKIYLDSCSQDHIIKSFDLISNMSDCEINIGLSGIVQGKSEVLSKGCGTALGLNVQMQIQISFHVVN